MKYDKVKVTDMVGNNPNAQQNMCNQVLTAFDTLATYPIDSPLQNFHNALLCFQQAEEIIHQALGAALNQLRVEKPELFKPANLCFAHEFRGREMSKQPVIEYEGCKFRVGVFADFANQGRKDVKLGTLINNLRINYRQGDTIYKNIVKTMDELLKKKEYKRAKPRRVEETIYFDDLDVVYDR